MLFDWFTVGAQVLNFLVLVWLMKRFLYKPVLDAIDAREKRIAQSLADAALKDAAAQKERDEFQAKNADFERQRKDLLSKTQDEIHTERKRLLDEARQAADALKTKRQNALTSEMQNLRQDIARRSRDEVFATADKVLTELADTTLQDRMVEVFTSRLRKLDDTDKAGLAKAMSTPGAPVCVRSTFALAPAQQEELQGAWHDALAQDKPLQFETTPEVIGGIELTANGWTLPWNIADFLAAMERSIDDLLKTQPAPQQTPAVAEEAP
ncbi:F0F1 ATP synthase subunit B [Rhodoferax sp.]|uniref:F0F1 ATP synthase subunit B family protein n=1 Tax=Rhodoferax sp. TaxID=50421 RepID=UPI0028420116|nr:F0F1 ATP synthase subunit B [Rhodoferax sp.]MDR3370531.1 F0F1 ATP synthase subunit B [Rhodoferax sp.]